MGNLTHEWHADLASFDDETLAEITADGHTFASPEWFRLADRLDLSAHVGGQVAIRYLVIREHGRPVAACPVMRASGEDLYFAYSIRRYYFDHWLDEILRRQPQLRGSFARLRRSVLAYRKFLEWCQAPLDEALIVGSPLTLRSQIAVAPSTETPRTTIYEALIRVLQRLSRRTRAPLWFLGVLGESSRLSGTLARSGFQKTLLYHDTVIEIDSFARFSDYLQSFRRSTRRAIQREIARAEQGDFTYTLGTDIAPSAEEFGTSEVSDGSSGARFFRQDGVFWRALGRSFGSKAEVIRAHQGERLAGFHVLLRNDRRGEIRSYRAGRPVGEGAPPRLQRRRSSDRSMIASLCYYEPIKRAIALGYRRLWLGPTAYESKTIRGAYLAPVYSHFWFPRRWDRWVLMPYLEQFGRVTHARITRSIERPAKIRTTVRESLRSNADT